MISISAVAYTILTIIVVALIFWLLQWALDTLVTKEPFHKVGQVVLVLGAVALCIYALLGLLSGQPLLRP